MISTFILKMIIALVAGIEYFFPVVTIASIPMVGPQISAVLVQVNGLFNAFLSLFPFAVIVWHLFIYVVLPFEVLLLVAKFFLGQHVPANIE